MEVQEKILLPNDALVFSIFKVLKKKKSISLNTAGKEILVCFSLSLKFMFLRHGAVSPFILCRIFCLP